MEDCCMQEPKTHHPPEICSPHPKRSKPNTVNVEEAAAVAVAASPVQAKPYTFNVEEAAVVPVAESPVRGSFSYNLQVNGVLTPDVYELCGDPCQPEGPPENFYIPCGFYRYNFLKEEYEWVYV
jgi:hypothetical protein